MNYKPYPHLNGTFHRKLTKQTMFLETPEKKSRFREDFEVKDKSHFCNQSRNGKKFFK